jgi:hypothetical protein
MTIPEMLEWVGIYCGWSPSRILSVIGDTGVNLNSLYVRRPRKENVFKTYEVMRCSAVTRLYFLYYHG